MSVLVTGGAGYIGSHMVWHLVDAGEEVVVLDNLSTGFDWAVAPEAQLVEGDCGDEALVGRLIAEHEVDAIIHFAGSIVVPESVADPLGYYLNNTVKTAGPDRGGGRGRGEALHLLLDGGGLRHAGGHAGRRGRAAPPGIALWPLEADDRDDARRRGGGPRSRAMWRCAISTSPAPIRPGAPASRPRRATHLIKVACETALGKRDGDHRLRHRLSDAGRHLHPRLHPRHRPGRRPCRRARAICAPAATAWSPIAAMAAAIRCSR